MFYAKLFKEFLFAFLYFIMCIVFKIHPFFLSFCTLECMTACVKTSHMDHMLITRCVLLATDSNSIVLHFDSLNKLKGHNVNLLSINMEVI